MMTSNREFSATFCQACAAVRYRRAEWRRVEYVKALRKGDLLLAAFHLKSWEKNHEQAGRFYANARALMGV